jgi:hypothetical protein
MFFIPGAFIAALTFPGVIIHELSHQLFCRLRRVPVYEVKYFQAKNPSGYVLHEASDSPLTNFIVSIGPFIVNTLIGALILFPSSVEISVFGLFGQLGSAASYQPYTVLRFALVLVSYWLGISILMHAFPSRGDAQVLVAAILKNKDVNIAVRILTAPFIGLIYLFSLGSVVWLDLIYAVAVSYLLPRLIGVFM